MKTADIFLITEKSRYYKKGKKRMTEKSTLADYPELMLDWDQELNNGIVPSLVPSGSHQYIKWRCHKCGRVWKAQVKNRVNGNGCTCDANERKTRNLRKHLVLRDGSLAETNPKIAAQWHPKLNGKLTPYDVTKKSTYKAWWIGDDGIAWQSVVSVRCRKDEGTKRPKNLAIEGVNDLKTLRPDLAAEWNYAKNTDIDIKTVIPGSKHKVWWICRKGHEWQASITSRNNGNGCPICNQERNTSFPEQATYYYVKKAFPDAKNRYYIDDRLEIDVFIPSLSIAIEYDGEYYHRSARKKDIDSKKNERLKELNILLIRIVEEGGQAPVGTDCVIECPYINRKAQIDIALINLFVLLEKLVGNNIKTDINIERDRAQIYEQYILSEKENSIIAIAPELIKEWHPTKNGRLLPEYVMAMSNKLFWWKCQKCGYEWKAPPYRRAKGMGCPACTGNIVVPGLNDLVTIRSDIAEEWDYEKNLKIDPHNYLPGSNKKVWWKCKKCSYSWEANISNRSRGTGCPNCAGKIVTVEKSLATVYPKIAAEWAYDLNSGILPESFLPGSDKKIWWRCDKGHVWKAAINSRVNKNNCPYCGNKKILPGFNDVQTVHPELMNEWDYQKNKVSPDQIITGSNKKVYWKCSQGHSWTASISNRIRGTGCPYCNRKYVFKGENDLKSEYPELADEWNFEKNTGISPDNIASGSNRKVWWKCKKGGGEWEAAVWSRTKGRGCPYCAGVRAIKGVNDLPTQRPDLIEEWSYSKNKEIDPQNYMPGSRAKVWWRCKKCNYEWLATIGSRSQGRGCPNCAGKVKTDRDAHLV